MNEYELIDITNSIKKSNDFLNNSYCGEIASCNKDEAIKYVREQFMKHEELSTMNNTAIVVCPQSFTKYENLNLEQLYNIITVINRTLNGKLLGKSIDGLINGGL